jgi:ornithine carbamoyltransferase
MAIKHLLSLADLRPEYLTHLVDRSIEFALGQVKIRTDLADKVVGIYFRKPSTSLLVRTTFKLSLGKPWKIRAGCWLAI